MKRKILFLIGIALCLGGTYAQNEEAAEAQKQDEKAIQSLIEELKDKDERIGKLEIELAELETENERLDSALQAEIKEGKAAKYKKQIKQLQKDSLALSEQMEEALEAMRQEHQKQINIFADQHEKDSLDIVALREELNGLKDFRVKWLAQLAESVDEKWLNKPYAVIDVTALEKDYAQYEQYAPMDAKVAEAKDKLTPFVANAHLYQRGKEAVNTIYNAEVVNSLIEPMRTLRDSLPEGSNQDDIDNIYWQLDNYAIAIKIFQKTIKEVNDKVKNRTQSAALPLAKQIIENKESELKMIPWLATQYDEYYKLLEKDASKLNEVGETILNITLPQ